MFFGAPNDEIERFLFGAIDNDGALAVRAVAGGDPRAVHDRFQDFFSYIDAQKIRTPKGLDWIRDRYGKIDQLKLMVEMQALRQMHCTMWLEAVREVVSAEDSDVKFIVTDIRSGVQPAMSAGSRQNRYPEDPPIEFIGSQTLFPLDANNCLILTNLEYAKKPAGVDLLRNRQNARHFGHTLARTDAWIRTRKLSSEEVIAINHIVKSRAHRYIAAAEEDWLYPERGARLIGERLARSYCRPNASSGISAARSWSATRMARRAFKTPSGEPRRATSTYAKSQSLRIPRLTNTVGAAAASRSSCAAKILRPKIACQRTCSASANEISCSSARSKIFWG